MKQLIAVVFLLIASLTASAQTAKTIAELEAANQKCLDKGEYMLGCEKNLYGQLDSVLNVVYNRLRAGLNPQNKLALKNEQIKWLAIRDKSFTDQKKAFNSLAQDDQMIAYSKVNDILKARVLTLIKRTELIPQAAAPAKTGTGLVQCVEKQSKPNENGDVTITRTCTYQKYRSVSIGEPDYKGRTFWTSSAYIKKSNRFVKVSNADFFNQKRDVLLSQLNKQFQINYKKDKDEATDPDTKSCFGPEKLEWYKWEDINMEFSGNSIVFNISYGLGDACHSQDMGGTSLPIKSLIVYLQP